MYVATGYKQNKGFESLPSIWCNWGSFSHLNQHQCGFIIFIDISFLNCMNGYFLTCIFPSASLNHFRRLFLRITMTIFIVIRISTSFALIALNPALSSIGIILACCEWLDRCFWRIWHMLFNTYLFWKGCNAFT